MPAIATLVRGTVLLAALFGASGAWPQACSSLADLLDDARIALRKVTRGADLDSAKAQARQARSTLDNAVAAAMACGCRRASAQLQSAASFARMAEDAGDGVHYRDYFNRAVLAYNNAVDFLKDCR